MGLAASQARFLGLTARKSNTEYEGQQVNQQRTALANESASLYSQLTNLSVPTPPDINQYYSTEYTFTIDGTSYTMTQLPRMTEDGTYSFVASYKAMNSKYEKVTDLEGIDTSSIVNGSAGKVALSQVSNLAKAVGDTQETHASRFSSGSDIYYNVGGVDCQYFKYISTPTIQDRDFQGVSFEFDSTGNFSSMQLANSGDKIVISTNNVANDDLYQQAMNEYNKEYSDYEKTMAQINDKTEVIQQQDKSLELRLNQLDTEQNAISTEMDAVQKVIDKNVESTFKTFA